MTRRLAPCLLLLSVQLGCLVVSCKGPDVGSPGLEPPSGNMGGSIAAGGSNAMQGGGDAGRGAGTGGANAAPGGAGGSGPVMGMAGSTSTPGDAVDAGAGASQDAGIADGGDTSGRFSTEHATEIEKDCQESVACLQQRDEVLEDDPVATCIRDTSTLLDEDESRREAFLANVARCADFVVCDYYDCALSMP